MIKNTSDGMFTFTMGKSTYKMGSKLFPLESKKLTKLFSCENTIELDDKEFMDALDSVKSFEEMGRCYTYSDIVYQIGKKLGRDVEFYAGWIFAGDIPVHHAWVVMDTNKVIDVNIGCTDHIVAQSVYVYALAQGLSEAELRKGYAKAFMENHKQKVSKVSKFAIMGRVPEGYIYIGCPSTRVTGLKTYQNMIDAFPDHPSYKRTRVDGRSELQHEMHKGLEKEGFYDK